MKELRRFLDSKVGEFSFYFEDLGSGYTYFSNERAEMPAAGCIKIPIAMALLKEVELSKVDLNTKIKINEADMVMGSGIIHEFKEREYSLSELMSAMLIQSDNTAANKLINLVTMERINEIIKEIGLKNTALKIKTSDVKQENDGQENTSTSYDLGKCLKALFTESYLNKEHSNWILHTLRKQQEKNKIPFYFPQQERKNIANKSGSLEGIENDMGLITISKGNFIFVVMSRNLSNNVYGTVTIERLGKMMWDIIDKGWK